MHRRRRKYVPYNTATAVRKGEDFEDRYVRGKGGLGTNNANVAPIENNKTKNHAPSYWNCPQQKRGRTAASLFPPVHGLTIIFQRTRVQKNGKCQLNQVAQTGRNAEPHASPPSAGILAETEKTFYIYGLVFGLLLFWIEKTK